MKDEEEFQRLLPQIGAYIRRHADSYSVNELVQGILKELGVEVPAVLVLNELKVLRKPAEAASKRDKDLDVQRKTVKPNTASTSEFMAELRRLANEGPDRDPGQRRGIRI